MKALVLEEYSKLVYKEMPEPEIGDNEVLVQVKACGICGSDVHGMDGSSGRRHPPLIMGHEASGIIVQRGERVNDFSKGDRVTFDSTIYCGTCFYCRQGHDQSVRQPQGARRCTRRIPPARGVCRICGGSRAYPLPAAGQAFLRPGGHGRTGLHRLSCGNPDPGLAQ